jgi:hypothetical protein
MVHGHVVLLGGYALLVMNVAVYGVIVWPNWSVAPLTETVYVAPLVSVADGVNVATVCWLSNETVPGTALPLESVSANVALLGVTGSLNVTLGVVEVGLLEEPAGGDALTIDGGGPLGCVVLKIASTP